MLVGDMDWYIWHSFLSRVISLVIQALFQWIQWHLLVCHFKHSCDHRDSSIILMHLNVFFR
ncbi:hypothetical protein K492DRAFT_81740 [Lichtheimia hyalospora FSU 10163]|nr:hypothetical protein K492DRAFT_81740 [Lichtheimia hyalospora FSU 10163]